jgi:hypothetical protein
VFPALGASAALLGLHVLHITLRIGLPVLGNGNCSGPGLFGAFPALTELVLFGGVVPVVPVPVLAAQIDAIRLRRVQRDGAL